MLQRHGVVPLGGDDVVKGARGIVGVLEARELVLRESEGFADTSLDEVADGGGAAAAADGEAEPRVIERVGDGEDGDGSPHLANARAEDGLKLSRMGEAMSAAKGRMLGVTRWHSAMLRL